MRTVDARLRWAMLSAGLEPTPESLARATGIPPGRARALFATTDPPEIVADLAATARRCQVRMLWLSTGASIPQISEILDRNERELLQVADSLDPAELRTFIAIGKRLLVK